MDSPNLLAALATRQASPEALITAARRAFEDVVMPALGRPLDFTMLAVRRGDDLSRERVPDALDWGAVPVGEPLEGLAVVPAHPDGDLAGLHVGFARPRRLVGGGVGEAEGTISFHVRRDVLDGATVTPAVQAAAVHWVHASFGEIDGSGGFVTLDHVASGPGAESPYERAVLRLAAQRDFTRHAWTYAWGVALPGGLVPAVGGVDAVRRRLPHSTELAGGGLWIQAGESLVAMTDAELHAVRDILAPLLPPGARAVDDYTGPPPLRL